MFNLKESVKYAYMLSKSIISNLLICILVYVIPFVILVTCTALIIYTYYDFVTYLFNINIVTIHSFIFEFSVNIFRFVFLNILFIPIIIFIITIFVKSLMD